MFHIPGRHTEYSSCSAICGKACFSGFPSTHLDFAAAQKLTARFVSLHLSHLSKYFWSKVSKCHLTQGLLDYSWFTREKPRLRIRFFSQQKKTFNLFIKSTAHCRAAFGEPFCKVLEYIIKNLNHSKVIFILKVADYRLFLTILVFLCTTYWSASCYTVLMVPLLFNDEDAIAYIQHLTCDIQRRTTTHTQENSTQKGPTSCCGIIVLTTAPPCCPGSIHSAFICTFGKKDINLFNKFNTQ